MIKSIFAAIGVVFTVFHACRAYDAHVKNKYDAEFGREVRAAADKLREAETKAA
jgi:hypothetical protein